MSGVLDSNNCAIPFSIVREHISSGVLMSMPFLPYRDGLKPCLEMQSNLRHLIWTLFEKTEYTLTKLEYFDISLAIFIVQTEPEFFWKATSWTELKQTFQPDRMVKIKVNRKTFINGRCVCGHNIDHFYKMIHKNRGIVMGSFCIMKTHSPYITSQMYELEHYKCRGEGCGKYVPYSSKSGVVSLELCGNCAKSSACIKCRKTYMCDSNGFCSKCRITWRVCVCHDTKTIKSIKRSLPCLCVQKKSELK